MYGPPYTIPSGYFHGWNYSTTTYMYRCAPNCATFHLISNFVLSRLGLLAYCDIPLSHRQHVLDNAWADPSVAFITRTALSHRLLHASGGYLNSKTFCHHHSPHTQRRSNMSRSMDLFRCACNFVMVRRLVREQRDHSVDRQPPQLLLKSDPAIPRWVGNCTFPLPLPFILPLDQCIRRSSPARCHA